MELDEAIKGRRSIRSYKPEDVPDTIVEKLIEAATYAPSAGNIQPWRFVIARNAAAKKELAEAANQTWIKEAPVVIVVCANEKRAEMGYGGRGRTLYCIQDTAAAIQNIHLTAYALGLGTCWIGAFSEDQARKVVNAPEEMMPVGMVSVGYPDEASSQRNRRPLSHILHHESF